MSVTVPFLPGSSIFLFPLRPFDQSRTVVCQWY